MPQITGKAVIRVDGEEWRTEDGAKLNPGGVTREAKAGGGKVHGFAEKTKAPELDCSVYHTRDTDLTAINAIRDATVMYESDTGGPLRPAQCLCHRTGRAGRGKRHRQCQNQRHLVREAVGGGYDKRTPCAGQACGGRCSGRRRPGARRLG